MAKGQSVKEALAEIEKNHTATVVDVKALGIEPTKRKRGGFRGRSKYNTVKIPLDGYEFDSQSEANRYMELKRKVRLGEIYALQPHPVFHLWVNDDLVCKYTADFQYKLASTNELVVEDVKNPVTAKLAAFRLKWRLMKACHKISVVILIR